jgi:hypothetical protein
MTPEINDGKRAVQVQIVKKWIVLTGKVLLFALILGICIVIMDKGCALPNAIRDSN